MRLWVLTGLLLIGCTAPRQTLTILHTNDIHGHFAAERATWRDDSALVGGFPALSGALDSVRAADEFTIYLDAGDLMTGNPICNMEVDGIEGGALLHMLNLCRVDAVAVGNHEFDLGGEHSRRFLATDQIDWLCGNVFLKDDSTMLCAAEKIIVRNKLRIGVIGLLLTDLAGVFSKKAIEPFIVQDIAEAAQPLINALDPKSDFIVLLTHNGFENDKLLARSVHGCDLIVGGHSHTRLSAPVMENGVIIAQAGSFLKQLGVMKFQVEKDRVTAYDGTLIELELARFTPDPAVKEYCAIYEEEIARVYGEEIAVAGADISRSYAATSGVGNLLCDLLREHYECDFAVVNSGGLRKDLAAGSIRRLDIVEMLPFTNSVTTFTASGDDLLVMAGKQAAAQHSGTSEILQMSGLEIQYSVVGDQIADILVTLAGRAIEPDRVYHGVSIDYVLRSQSEKYLGFAPSDMQDSGTLFSDFVIAALASSPQPILPNTEQRLKRNEP